jgi:hypothetical protein
MNRGEAKSQSAANRPMVSTANTVNYGPQAADTVMRNYLGSAKTGSGGDPNSQLSVLPNMDRVLGSGIQSSHGHGGEAQYPNWAPKTSATSYINSVKKPAMP